MRSPCSDPAPGRHRAEDRRNHRAEDHPGHPEVDHLEVDHLAEVRHRDRPAEARLVADRLDHLAVGLPFHPEADHLEADHQEEERHLEEERHPAEDHLAEAHLRQGSPRHRGLQPSFRPRDRPDRLDLAHPGLRAQGRGPRAERPGLQAGRVRRPGRAAPRRASCLSAKVWALLAAPKQAVVALLAER